MIDKRIQNGTHYANVQGFDDTTNIIEIFVYDGDNDLIGIACFDMATKTGTADIEYGDNTVPFDYDQWFPKNNDDVVDIMLWLIKNQNGLDDE